MSVDTISRIQINLSRQTILGRLADGEVILGDGSYVFTLERRCYATAGVSCDWLARVT